MASQLSSFFQSNDFIRSLWSPRPLISAGRYTREMALDVAEQTGQLIAFGRPFISNVSSSTQATVSSLTIASAKHAQPDLPLRLRQDIRLADWDPETFDTPEDPHGYIDYPFADPGAK